MEVPLQLLKFPELVLWSIFSVMEFEEKLDLSFCSRKSAAIVRRNSTSPIRMEISIVKHMPYIAVWHTKQPKSGRYKLFVQKGTNGFDENDSKRNLSGVKVLGKWSPKSTIFCSVINQPTPTPPHEIFHGLLSHILQVFPNCHVESLFINFNVSKENFDVKIALPSMSTVDTVELGGSKMFTRDLVFLLQNLKIRNEFISYCQPPLQCWAQSFGEIPKITVNPAKWVTRKMLLNLNSEVVILHNCYFENDDLMAFFEKWKTSTASDDGLMKLRFLKVDLKFESDLLDYEKLGGVDFDYKEHLDYLSDKTKAELNQHIATNIKRDDGMIASIFRFGVRETTARFYGFFVWDEGIPIVVQRRPVEENPEGEGAGIQNPENEGPQEAENPGNVDDGPENEE